MNKMYWLFLALFLMTACSSQSANPSDIRVAKLGDVYTEQRVQEVYTNNCDGANPRVDVSRSLQKEQTTFFQIEVEAGAIVRGTPLPTALQTDIEGKIRVALNVETGEMDYHTTNLVLETPIGTSLKHRIVWNETKVNGITDVVYPSGTAKLNFKKLLYVDLYNRSSEALSCPEGSVTSPALPTPALTPTKIIQIASPTLPVPSTIPTKSVKVTNIPTITSTVSALCPFTITQNELNSWRVGLTDVSTVQARIIDFNKGRPNNGGAFPEGAVIPAGVAVATNFDEINANKWSQYPVIAIVHSGSWGIFQTTREYVAPNAGACRVIIP